jgi:hypothetical protein
MTKHNIALSADSLKPAAEEPVRDFTRYSFKGHRCWYNTTRNPKGEFHD